MHYLKQKQSCRFYIVSFLSYAIRVFNFSLHSLWYNLCWLIIDLYLKTRRKQINIFSSNIYNGILISIKINFEFLYQIVGRVTNIFLRYLANLTTFYSLESCIKGKKKECIMKKALSYRPSWFFRCVLVCFCVCMDAFTGESSFTSIVICGWCQVSSLIILHWYMDTGSFPEQRFPLHPHLTIP